MVGLNDMVHFTCMKKLGNFILVHTRPSTYTNISNNSVENVMFQGSKIDSEDLKGIKLLMFGSQYRYNSNNDIFYRAYNCKLYSCTCTCMCMYTENTKRALTCSYKLCLSFFLQRLKLLLHE